MEQETLFTRPADAKLQLPGRGLNQAVVKLLSTIVR
jgi:hypothetical protein